MVIVDLWVGDIWVLFPFHRWMVVAVDRGSRLRFDQVLDLGSLLIIFCFVWVLVDLVFLVDLVGLGFVIWVEVMGGGAVAVAFGFCSGFVMG